VSSPYRDALFAEDIFCGLFYDGRSQWPRGVRHELFSLTQTLGSWVRIPLKARISVCVYSAFVLLCV
jgi:hypothetical protein